MSVVRPGDDAPGEGYPTSNTPGQGLGQLLGLSGQQVENAKEGASKKAQGTAQAASKSASEVKGSFESSAQEARHKGGGTERSATSKAGETKEAVRSSTKGNGVSGTQGQAEGDQIKSQIIGRAGEAEQRTTASTGQLVTQQVGADKWESAAEETLAARDAAGRISVGKAELEEASRRFEELHDTAIERANKAIAAAEELDSLKDKAAAKDAAVKQLLQDLAEAKKATEKYHTEEGSAKEAADKAAEVHKDAARQAGELPQKLGEKKRKAEKIRNDIDDLTKALHKLQAEIRDDESEGAKIRQKADAFEEQVHAKANARQDAASRLQTAEAQADKIQQELGQQQREKDSTADAAQKLEQEARQKDSASKKVDARKAAAEEDVKTKFEAIQGEERTAQKHWQQAKKLGNSADAETEATQNAALKKVEKRT